MYIKKTLLGKPKHVAEVGDVVWWAPKRLECTVQSINAAEHTMLFAGGPSIQRSASSKPVARWLVHVALRDAHWHEGLKMWIVGEGLYPRIVRGVIIKPDPITIVLKPGQF